MDSNDDPSQEQDSQHTTDHEEFGVRELLRAVIEGARKAYYCKKNCHQLQTLLEHLQPLLENTLIPPTDDVAAPASSAALSQDLKELLDEAKCVVDACEDGRVRHPMIARIWSKHMMSTWILNIGQRTVARCNTSLLADESFLEQKTKVQTSIRELGKLTLSAAGQQEMGKLGMLIPSSIESQDTAVLRDAYHRYMSTLTSSDLGAGHVIPMSVANLQPQSTPKPFFGLEELSEEASWTLFCLSAFNCEEPDFAPESANLEEVAREVCKACAGVPLTLQVVGGAMAGKTGVEEWWSTLRQLKDASLNPLKIGVDDLDDVTKKCFLYFAAFSDEGERFDEMFLLWHSAGLFGDVVEDDARDEAWVQWGILAARSLIEIRYPENASMHHLVRHLATSVTQDHTIQECEQEFLLKPKTGLTEFPNLWTEQTLKAEVMSLADNGVQSLPDLLHAPNLKSLLLRENSSIEIIPEGLFRSLSGSLRVLDLSRTSLRRLPEDVGDLGSLEYLLVAESKLEELPKSIGNLHNLKYVVLSCTHIEELPEEIGNLHQLKYLSLRRSSFSGPLPASIAKLEHLEHLDLSHCRNLDILPPEIRNMASLKVLKLPHEMIWKEAEKRHMSYLGTAYNYYRDEEEESREVAGLEDIACLENLQTLLIPGQWDTCPDDSPITFLSDVELERLATSILAIPSLHWVELRHFFVSDEIQSLGELRKLGLTQARGMVAPRWLEGCRHLTYLSLHTCDSVLELPALDTLQDLQELIVYGCKALQSIPTSFTRRNEFASLVRFEFFRCKKVKRAFWFPEMKSADAMPKLQTLRLRRVRVSEPSKRILAEKKLVEKAENHWQHSNLLDLIFDPITPPNALVALELDTSWL